MKNIILILIIALFSANLLAASPLWNSGEKCRLDVTNIDTGLSINEQITKDLLSGIWTKKTDHQSETKATTSFQFIATGLVGILTQGMEGLTNYKYQTWELKLTNSGAAVLILTDVKTEKRQAYQVTRHCNGLHLTNNETMETIEWIYLPKQLNKKVATTMKTLTGSWKCMMMPKNDSKKSKNTFYQYELHKDGSMKKTLDGENMEAIVQKGFWQISPNGKYLVMYFQEGQEFNISIAEINYLAFDELVLGKSIAFSNLEKKLCANSESFYFNKQ